MKRQPLILIWIVMVLSAIVVPSTFADGPIEGRIGRAEVRFMEGMSDHHQMAIDMANDCLAKATTESLRSVCQDIIDAQSAEIAQMQEWLMSWYSISYVPMPMMDMINMMDMMPMMPNMEGMDHGMMGEVATEMPEGLFTDPPMMMGMMAGLNRFEGAEYEIAWMESMIDHHDDAIHMAERLLERVPEGEGHAELRSLAEQIITDQTAEIETLESLINQVSA